MSKFIMALIVMALVSGCNERKYQYIKTDRGLLGYSIGYCALGMLTNNDGNNIYDENNNPITCDGYVYLSEAERMAIKSKGE